MDNARQHELGIFTCSRASDLERCERLCRSIDRWVSGSVTHWVVVPARDLSLFRRLSNGRRNIVATEDCVPGKFWQVPGSCSWWFESGAGPRRDSVIQQLTRLSANHISNADCFAFVDTDLQFVRPFSLDNVSRQGKLRLHRKTGVKREGKELQWHRKTSDLIGVKKQSMSRDYAGQLVTWRRTHLEGLQRLLENQQSRPWYQSVSRAKNLCGYALYGTYLEAVVGIDNSEHFVCDVDPVYSCEAREVADALERGATPLSERAVAILLKAELGPWTLRHCSKWPSIHAIDTSFG